LTSKLQHKYSYCTLTIYSGGHLTVFQR
jgi:hypothetical protein